VRTNLYLRATSEQEHELRREVERWRFERMVRSWWLAFWWMAAIMLGGAVAEMLGA
jgi:hypothetical protein